MKQVGVYNAKTHLPSLLEEVEKGETIEITRHGRPVARLVPLERKRMTPTEAVDALLKFPRVKLGPGETIKSLINEGRKY